MTRAAYLRAADVAVDLLDSPAVAQSWARPSALADMSVAALAAHLARQITRVVHELDEPVPAMPPISLTDHFGLAHWLGQKADHEANVGIRHRAERDAEGGFEAVRSAARAALETLRRRLPAEPEDRLVPVPAGSLALDDFLTTRLLELAVHCDDLAVSVGVETPAMPPEVTEPVLDLLVRLAARRHGVTAVLRALSREERTPATISVF